VPSSGPGGLLLFTQVGHYRSLAPHCPRTAFRGAGPERSRHGKRGKCCFLCLLVIPIRTPPLASCRHPGGFTRKESEVAWAARRAKAHTAHTGQTIQSLMLSTNSNGGRTIRLLRPRQACCLRNATPDAYCTRTIHSSHNYLRMSRGLLFSQHGGNEGRSGVRRMAGTNNGATSRTLIVVDYCVLSLQCCLLLSTCYLYSTVLVLGLHLCIPLFLLRPILT
jgi:hypothetical protein